tara:strand:+ start:1655 stop:2494 length:840 start_codon:yes stop_codon:yes gene_type:complete
MKVGIIGLGFVGNALEKVINSNVSIIKIDPKLNTSVRDLENQECNILFVCVPTPMDEGGGQDLKIVTKVLNEIEKYSTDSLVVMKSTILPDKIESLSKGFPSFVYNPEFLREKHAFEDLKNSSFFIFGGDKKNSKKLANFYKFHTSCKGTDFNYTNLKTASLVKYAINSFLATKVVFFNELRNIYVNSGTEGSWNDFVQLISKDIRIGSSHMSVPGPDGRFGFGGACFPKDTSALESYAKNLNAHMELLEKVISVNNDLRSAYNETTKREKEQNIKYKK